MSKWPKDECPNCGNLKFVSSKLCRSCFDTPNPHCGKDQCPSCGGLKDVRSKQCMHCRMTLNPMRLGTGKGWYEHSSGYMIGSFGKGPEYQHINVMEKYLGRKLENEECVHHCDSVRSHNKLNNLELMLKDEHARLHLRKRRRDSYGCFI